uniref:Uncharacterized protein n=1 Tax=Zonotrichia albicollis TaxID=44394 RepID=A0A8D2MQ38_ZONAL
QGLLSSSQEPLPVEGRESLQKLYHLLEVKGFQTRMEGVALLLDLSKTSPQLISTNIVQVCRVSSFFLSFCSFPKPAEVKLIQCVLALHPGCLGLAGIIKNLNSKDLGVRAAAVTALDQSVVHLDPSLCRGWWVGSCVSVPAVLVEWVYARSPEVVQRYTLPVLWSCLENKVLLVRSANVCAVVTKLACALCEVMGTQLIKCADSKPPHMQENLSSLLGWR